MKDGWAALDDANRIVDIAPEAGDGFYVRGLALELVGDRPGAEQNLRSASDRACAPVDGSIYERSAASASSSVVCALE